MRRVLPRSGAGNNPPNSPAKPGSGGDGARPSASEDGAIKALCPLCDRPLIPGPSVDRHHWVPKAWGGRETSPLHAVCHRMVHRLFDDVTLARDMNTAAVLRAHPDMARFLAWIRRQPPDYLDWPEQPGRHGRHAPTRRGGRKGSR